MLNNKRIIIDSDNYFTLKCPENMSDFTTEEILELSSLLNNCACYTKEEEINEIIYIAKKNNNDSERFIKLLPHTLKKLATKKNRVIYEKKLKEIYALKADFPKQFEKIKKKIIEVENQANIRFST